MAALFAGFLISWITQSVGWPFQVLFLLGALGAVLLVRPQGLFVTTAMVPILFAVFIVLAGWIVNWSDLPPGGDSFSTTSVVMSVYPLVQYFPVLLTAVIGVIVIALIRLWIAKETQRRESRARVNRRGSRTPRNQTAYVTVDELSSRMSEDAFGASPSSRGSYRPRRPARRLEH